MFSVIGVDGGVFRGTLEHLLVAHRVPPLRHRRGVQQEGEEAPAATAATSHDDKRYQAAAAAYAGGVKYHPDRGPIYHAYQVMTRRVLTVSPDTRADVAWRTLVERGVGQAPVVNARGRVVGLVWREQLLHLQSGADGTLGYVLARTVGEVMETPVVTADPVSDVRRIALVMLDYHLPALPVVDEQTDLLVGIVSRSDLLRCVVTDPPLTLWA